jgi:hypothetical protein
MRGLKKSSEKFLAEIEERQNTLPAIDIDISKMPIPLDTISRVGKALMNRQDFALKNDEGGIALFVNQEWLVVIPSEGPRSYTHCSDAHGFHNALKLALLGHHSFVDNWIVKYNPVYKALLSAFVGDNSTAGRIDRIG